MILQVCRPGCEDGATAALTFWFKPPKPSQEVAGWLLPLGCIKRWNPEWTLPAMEIHSCIVQTSDVVPHLDLENDQEAIRPNCATHLGRISSCICLAPYSKYDHVGPRLRQTPPVLLDTNGQWRTEQLLATRHTSVGIALNYQIL